MLYHDSCYRRKQNVCCVARLKASRNVVRGHVLPSPSMLATLGTTAHESVCVRVIRLPALSPSSVTLSTNLETQDDGHAALACQVRQSFLHWSSSTEQSRVVSSGSVVRLELENGDIIRAIADVQYEAEEAFSAEQQEGNACVRMRFSLSRHERLVHNTNCILLLQVLLWARLNSTLFLVQAKAGMSYLWAR